MLLLKDTTGSKATGLSGKHDTNSRDVHHHVTRSVYSQVDQLASASFNLPQCSPESQGNRYRQYFEQRFCGCIGY